ncbi:MAG TPA: pyridoxamine 5'-phosphate oxidase family protein [Dehalococcoidia bacterium]|jgi:nitroimidazol reductase NimA-like FMN-containing flavoprotein (pyridoxamine 5'-phosphate oxidase superfamily)|nr:pyridoxamine 5'-phosphate oxidase family protein [Dehalococcoidia bacterium]
MSNASEPKKPLEVMPRDQLDQHLIEFMKSHNVCVLATTKDNIPRATSLEYEAEGTTLYIMVDRGRKIENMRANSQISVAIHDPLHGWLTVKGIQITAQAKLLTDSDAEYSGTWKIFNRSNAGKEGWDTPPKDRTFLIIKPQKIELIETALREKGYKMQQVWEAQS